MTRYLSASRLAGPLAAFALAAALSACSVFNESPSDKGKGPTVVRVPFSGDFTYEVDTGDAERDVFFVFSASADGSSPSTASVKNIVVDGTVLPVPSAPKLPATYGATATGTQRIADFNAEAMARVRTLPRTGRAPTFGGSVPTVRASDVAGTSNGDLYSITNSDRNTISPVASTCRLVVGPFTVADGTSRSLSIWVADNQWDTNGAKIQPAMVTALADRFLKTDSDNDIYDWLTTILGPEWGTYASATYKDLISFDGNITILLTDIDSGNPKDSDSSGIIGYFYSANNFKDAYALSYFGNHSNERIMFVIDAPMYANQDDADGNPIGAWSATNYWPEEVYSTLAHEFQHMIHFYQKGVVRGAGDAAEVWIDEFCAQLAEDLLADKMQVQGPRGVSYTNGTSGSAGNKEGRLPYYNQYTYRQLTVTGVFSLLDYSTVYAFASWAARNYGGSEFLRRVVQSPYKDRRAVEQAAAAGGASPSDLNSLIGRWAVAVMNSDRTDLPAGYRSNIGDWFTSKSGGKDYRLGSIDYFKYLPRDYYTGAYGQTGGPVIIEKGQSITTQYAGSNVYFAAARDQVGSRKFTVSLPSGVMMHLVLR